MKKIGVGLHIFDQVLQDEGERVVGAIKEASEQALKGTSYELSGVEVVERENADSKSANYYCGPRRAWPWGWGSGKIGANGYDFKRNTGWMDYGWRMMQIQTHASRTHREYGCDKDERNFPEYKAAERLRPLQWSTIELRDKIRAQVETLLQHDNKIYMRALLPLRWLLGGRVGRRNHIKVGIWRVAVGIKDGVSGYEFEAAWGKG